jgi:predicted dehydrogenase
MKMIPINQWSCESKAHNRRVFLRKATMAATFPFIGKVLGANDQIGVACIGVSGKGNTDLDHVAQCGGRVVALCDVDENNLKRKAQKYPQAARYRDYRQLLEKMAKSIDAVTVSVPDHHHGVAAARAMQLGKHVYCQKPLAQTVAEARLLRQLAQTNKLATQMGNQGSANNGLRRAVEIIQAGIIGPVRELHVWSNRPTWPQGMDRPPGEDLAPATLDWDLWLGPAPLRPFKTGVYHPGRWRGWHDFGTGALGDMGCHTINMPFRALKLGLPTVVECELASRCGNETYPKTSRIRFDFPDRAGLPPLKFWWYDGNPNDKSLRPLRPQPELVKEILPLFDSLAPSGILVLGDKGQLYSPDEGGGRFYLKLTDDKEFKPGRDHEATQAVAQIIPRAPEGKEDPRLKLEGFRNFTLAIDFRTDEDLWQKEEWFRMMRGGPPAYSNFDIAAELTEVLLLGCLAVRLGVGHKLEWDGPNLRSPNCPEAAPFLTRENRPGWR